MTHSIEMAREKGYTQTLCQRRCYLPDINSNNAVVRGYAERNAINAPIQGSAADIIKRAMIRIQKRLQTEGMRSKMILQVHDELNFSVPPEEKEQLQALVIEEMQGAYELRVPLVADCGWGTNWLEAMKLVAEHAPELAGGTLSPPNIFGQRYRRESGGKCLPPSPQTFESSVANV